MGKLQIPRSKTSDRTPFQPASRAFAPPSAVRRSPQAPALASEAALQRAALLGHNVANLTKIPLQAKLTLGPVGDKYEQEADGVARQVMQQIAAPTAAEPAVDTETAPGVAQRAGELDDDDLNLKPLPGAVQRIGELDDDDLNLKPLPGAVQRGPGDLDDDDLNLKPLPGAVQRDSTGLEGGPISGDIEGSIEGARSGGRSLDKDLRSSMEPAFGADFSGVRVHADAKADGLNRSLQARAFTTGQDVFFRSGEYNPGSAGGKELLAHELTHVVQQNGPAVMKKQDEQ
jgi:hypothetical protein